MTPLRRFLAAALLAALVWASQPPQSPLAGDPPQEAATTPAPAPDPEAAALAACGGLIRDAVLQTHQGVDPAYVSTLAGLVCASSRSAGADPVKVSAIVSVESSWVDIGFRPSMGNYGPMQVNRCHLGTYGPGFTSSLEENVRVGVDVFGRVGWSYSRYNGGGTPGYASKAAKAEARIRKALAGASPWGEAGGL